jgi:tetratricopeptide (TPR) repeat protein
MGESAYILEQRAYERKTSNRFRNKLRRLAESNDYRRKAARRTDPGEPNFPIEDATTILTAIWLDLRGTLSPPHLSHAAWVLRCFLEIDAADVPHRSVKVRVCKSYAVKKGVSEEQARLDFLDGVERLHRAARRVFFTSRETALTNFHESLLVIKRLEAIDSEFVPDDEIGFVDQYIGELDTLVSRLGGKAMYNEVAAGICTQLEQKKLSKGSLCYRGQLSILPEQCQEIVFLFESGADIQSIREHLLKAPGRIIKGENQELLGNQLFLKAIEDIRTAFDLQHPERARSLNKRSAKEEAELRDLDAIVAEAMQSTQLDPRSEFSIKLYQQAVHEGRYEDAKKLYQTHLERPLRYELGAHHLCIGLLQVFFPDGGHRPTRLTKEHDKGWVLNTLANLRAYVGDPRVARLYQAAIKISEALQDKVCLASGLYDLANFQLALGQIKRAEQNVRRGLELSYEVGHDFYKGLGHQELGLLYSYKGEFDNAREQLRNALFFFTVRDELQAECVVWQYLCLCSLFAGNPEFVLIDARAAQALANQVRARRFPVKRDFLRIQWLLGWAQVALAGKAGQRKDAKDKYLDEAEEHLAESLTGCRETSLVELEPDVLLAWGRWHRASGNTGHARQSAEQARGIAERCGYRLKLAEIHNFLARLALDEGNKEMAKEQAEIAKKYALCDGPGYCYKPALEQARRLIG